MLMLQKNSELDLSVFWLQISSRIQSPSQAKRANELKSKITIIFIGAVGSTSQPSSFWLPQLPLHFLRSQTISILLCHSFQIGLFQVEIFIWERSKTVGRRGTAVLTLSLSIPIGQNKRFNLRRSFIVIATSFFTRTILIADRRQLPQMKLSVTEAERSDPNPKLNDRIINHRMCKWRRDVEWLMNGSTWTTA